MIQIDGSYGEGGGQIIRTAIAMSAVTGKPIKITNIRANRSNPGLQPQHLTGVKAAAELCNAKVSGAELGSTELTFEPSKIQFGKFRFDIGTAGAITLVLQTLIPIAAFAPGTVRLEIRGGTHALHSPPIEYFQNIFCDYVEKFGLIVTANVEKYGFFPKGGGIVKVEVKPAKSYKPLNLTERGKLLNLKVFSIASEDLKTANVADRQVAGFRNGLPVDYLVKVFTDYTKTLSTGSAVYAHALYANCKLACSALGERGKKAEDVGNECADGLMKEINSSATVDKHLADQLIPFLGLFGGEFVTSEITEHTKTNIWVVEKFINKKFAIEGNKIAV
ncbi:MAG: RNA 3'-terminal phosphate cyclase [DPANN group archaeon]|nr:RNA 3'-terminal phosphate cyclase [DPANN group archaeon]